MDSKHTKHTVDYSRLDRPEILALLFHPRLEWSNPPDNCEDLMIPVEDDVAIGARFHPCDQASPIILFFHGNGEIVADYDEMAPLYNRLGINFLPMDYRGYGRSGGQPTITTMMRDCHAIFEFAGKWLRDNGYKGTTLDDGLDRCHLQRGQIIGYGKGYFRLLGRKHLLEQIQNLIGVWITHHQVLHVLC